MELPRQSNNPGKIVQVLADGLARKRGYKSANEIPCDRPKQCNFPKLCRACSLKAEFYQEARRRANVDLATKGYKRT